MLVRKMRKHDDSDIASKAGILYIYFSDRAKKELDRLMSEKKKRKQREKERDASKKCVRYFFDVIFLCCCGCEYFCGLACMC